MSKKRQRERHDVSVQLVEIYEDLANENEEIRLKAAAQLLARENLSREDVLATFRRLVRGLCSSRKAARLGFSIALTEFITQYAQSPLPASKSLSVSQEDLVRLLQENTQTSEKVSGQEKRDYLLGRLFAAEALIKSKVIFGPKDAFVWDRILDLILELAQKKSWLREESGWVLLEALRILQSVPRGVVFAQSLINKVHDNGLTRCLEGVALWITARELFSELELPKNAFPHDDPLNRNEKTRLIRTLKESPSGAATKESGDKEEAKPGPWASKLNFAWEIILSSSLKNEAKRVSFSSLWTVVVDEGMFALSSSSERKHRGFLLTQQYIPSVPANKLPIVLGTNLIRCLVNQLTKKDTYLHKMAERTLKAIQNRASADPQASFPIMKTIVESHGYANFDTLTKSKTIDKIVHAVKLEATKDVFTVFESAMIRPKVNEAKTASFTRQLCADYLLTSVRSLTIPARERVVDYALYRQFMGFILALFVQLGYFNSYVSPVDANAHTSEPEITEVTQRMFQARLLSSLSHLIARDHQPAFHPYQVAQILHNGLADGSGKSHKADEGVRRTIRSGWKALSRIHDKALSKEGENEGNFRAFELLFSMAIIQAYSGEADAVDILAELKDCHQSILEDKPSGKQSAESTVLVEIILSLISKPSLLFRRLAQQVFSSFSVSIGHDALDSMIDEVLKTKETAEGQNELFDEVPKDVDVEMDVGGASDVEESQLEEDSDDDEGSINEGSASEEANSEAAEFEKKLAEALGTRRADEDAAISESESSDEDMNDEQMESLDPFMTKIFQERSKETSKKKERKNAKENMVQFKCKVLELLQIYIKQQFSKSTALNLICPLLDLIRTTSSKQVSQKACELVRDFMKAYKLNFSSSKDETALNTARDFLPRVHSLVALDGSNAYHSACSQASLLLVKVLLKNGGTIEEAWAEYSKTGNKLATGPNFKVIVALVQDWGNWFASAHPILEKLK